MHKLKYDRLSTVNDNGRGLVPEKPDQTLRRACCSSDRCMKTISGSI